MNATAFARAVGDLCRENSPGAVFRLERLSDGDLIHEQAAGRFRADDPRPMRPGDRFHIASIAKTMTAALVLDQAGKGGFGPRGLGATLGDLDLFPVSVLDALHREGGAAITLDQLLTHTAGIRDAMVDDAARLGGPSPGSLIGRLMAPGGDPARSWLPFDPARPFQADAGVLNWYLGTGLGAAALSAPGAAFHYSDTGYVILGLALERVTGRPLGRLLREDLFAPLSMGSSYQAYRDDPPGLDDRRSSESDPHAGGIPCLSAGVSLSFDWAGGGVVSTTADLARLARAIAVGNLALRADGWRQPPGLQPPRHGVAPGLFRWVWPDGLSGWGHAGAWGAKMLVLPEADLILTASINDSGRGDDWHSPLLSALLSA